MKKIALGLSSLAISVAAATAHAGEVEVLHWWTSGGEAKSINVLKELMTEQGHTWKALPLLLVVSVVYLHHAASSCTFQSLGIPESG